MRPETTSMARIVRNTRCMKSGTSRWSRTSSALVALIVVALQACSSGSGEPAERANAGSSVSTLSPASSGTITTGVAGDAASAVPGTHATVASPGRGSSTEVSGTTLSGTAAAAPADPGCPGIRCVSIVLTGDVLVHPPLVDQARTDGAPAPGLDFAPILAAQEGFVAAADLAVCHLETPVAPPDGPFEGYPLFSVPPQVLTGLTAVGYDACTTASNHTLDQGPAGLARTLDALDAAGLAHTGSYRSAQESEDPAVLDAAGARVTVISATYGLNTGPPDPSWQVDLVDTDRIRRDAARAAELGADLVIVALHDGTEYQAEPTAQQRRHAEELLADPAVDLVYGHHAHVVQPLQRLQRQMGGVRAGQHDRRPRDARSRNPRRPAAPRHVQPRSGRRVVDQRHRLGRLIPATGTTPPMVRTDVNLRMLRVHDRRRRSVGSDDRDGEPIRRRRRRRTPTHRTLIAETATIAPGRRQPPEPTGPADTTAT